MWAARIENYLSRVFMENGRVQPTTLRPIIIEGRERSDHLETNLALDALQGFLAYVIDDLNRAV